MRPEARSCEVGALVGALLLASAGVAQAEPKDACITAYEHTQTLRHDGKLGAAKEQAAICARDACPALLSKDCKAWLGEIESSMPSVVFEARRATGESVTDARVLVDGSELVARLDGRAVSVDPGMHVFRFEREGAPPVEERVVVREGEKGRKIVVTLASPAPGGQASSERPIPLGVWIFGGVSVAALATSAVFAIDGLSKKDELEACKPSCPPEDVDAMSARFTVADVALGAGVMAALAATYLFFTRPPTATGPGVKGAVSPVRGGAALGLGGRF